jgi:hypothetical protein
MKRVFLFVVLLACTRSKDPTVDPSASASASTTSCVAGGSCSKADGMCTPTPIGTSWSHALQCQSGKWTELEIAPLPTPATAASASPQGRAQAAPRTLPKLDLTCNTDADCTITDDEIQDDAPRSYACCPGCSQHAVSSAWYKSFQSACAASPAPMCPPIGCAMPVVKAACKSHRCEVVTPKP